MALVPKIDPNKIFASNAPTQDKPAAFDNYEKGMDETRKNLGRPTIPQLNYLHQTADQKILWIHQNGGGLPYDASIEYAEKAVTLKDGELKQLVDGTWVEVNTKATSITTASDQNQQQINDFGGAKWYAKSGGYELGATVKLANGDTVKSISPANTVDPNVAMTGWVKKNDASQIFDKLGKSLQEINNYTENVNTWGAVGDGSLHTLQEWVDSGRFSSLAVIQFIYPNATSLAESIDAVAIQACLNYSRPLNKKVTGVVGCNYIIDKTIDLNSNADFEGTTFTVDKTFSTSVVKTSSSTIGVNLLSKLVIKYPTILNNRSVGTETPIVGSKGIFLEGVRNCTLYFGGVRGFETNLYMFSDNGNKYISYNQLFFSDLFAGSKINIHLDIKGTGWINQCVWNGGQFAQYSQDTSLFETVCLKHSKVAGGQNAANGHTFVGCSMEGAFTHTILYDFDPAITASYFSSNTWVGCRFEAAQAMTFSKYALYDTFIMSRGLDSITFTGGGAVQFVGCPRITNFVQDVGILVGSAGMRTSIRSHIFQANNSANALVAAFGFNGNINGGFKADGSLVIFNSTDNTKVQPSVQLGMLSGTPSVALGNGDATPTERIFKYGVADWRMNISLSPSVTGTYNLGSSALRFNEVYAVKFRASEGLGVWGTVPPTVKPSITGKLNPATIAEQNAVLSSIVSALGLYGLALDSRIA